MCQTPVWAKWWRNDFCRRADIGLDGTLLGARMEIFKCWMFRMESAFIAALRNERMTHQYNYLHNAYGNKWLTCLPIYSLQQRISPGSRRAAHISFGSNFLKEPRVMLKTQQFFLQACPQPCHISMQTHREVLLCWMSPAVYNPNRRDGAAQLLLHNLSLITRIPSKHCGILVNNLLCLLCVFSFAWAGW